MSTSSRTQFVLIFVFAISVLFVVGYRELNKVSPRVVEPTYTEVPNGTEAASDARRSAYELLRNDDIDWADYPGRVRTCIRNEFLSTSKSYAATRERCLDEYVNGGN